MSPGAPSTQSSTQDVVPSAASLQVAENGTADPDWTDLNAAMERMHTATARVERTGDSDRDFVRLMLPHHQAAIDMAKAQLVYGTDRQMRRLAQEIITDQQSEIELMQLWLKQHWHQK